MTHAPYDGSEGSFNEVLDFLSVTYRWYGRLHNWSINRFGNWRFGGNSKLLKNDPQFLVRNLHIWRNGVGITGAVVRESNGPVTIQTHPDHLDLIEEMLDWVEQGGQVPVCAWNNDAWMRGILNDRSYRMVESGGFNRKYDTSLSPHRYPIPEKYELVDLAHFLDPDEYIRAVREAFGKEVIDRDWYDSNIQAPGHDPRWVLCVTAPGGRCASFADVRIDRVANYAEIDPIGTHPDFQRKGLAKACIAECFRRLHAEGVRHAYIGSAPEPAPSNRLYDSLRPIERYEEQVWARDPCSERTIY